MKISARNQFAGPVIAIKEGVVDAEVSIRLAPELMLTDETDPLTTTLCKLRGLFSRH